MTRTRDEDTPMSLMLELMSKEGFDGMARAVEILLNEAMKLERDEFLQAGPHQRTADRRGYANGYKSKTVKTRVGQLDLVVPQVRNLEEGVEGFYPNALEKGVRSERALKLAVAEMYVQGVSTRKVVAITKELCGLDVTSSQVSRAARALDDELERWRRREIGEVAYLHLDARYDSVRQDGVVASCATLVAIGILADGRRTILGVSTSRSEAEVHWRDFLASLQDRGMHGVKLVTSDDHAGLKAALAARLAGVPWQRCQAHLQRNAASYVPRKAMQAEVHREIRNVFDAPDLEEGERRVNAVVAKYEKSAAKLASWMDENLREGLTVLRMPPAHRRRLRTTNMVERLNRELKRRTRVVSVFPNEDSLLRLVSAVLMEQSEEWETGRTYLTMEQA